MTEPIPDSVQKHQRDVRRRIMLPMLLSMLLLVGVTVVLFVLSVTGDVTAQQIGIVAACLVTLFVLLPIALIFLVVDGLLLLLMFGIGPVHEYVRKPFRLLQDYTAQGVAITHRTAERIAAPIIDIRSAGARWRHLLVENIPEGETASEE